jgi:hypothetical protein
VSQKDARSRRTKAKDSTTSGLLWSKNSGMTIFLIRGRLFMRRMTLLKDHKQANYDDTSGERNYGNDSSKPRH